MNIKYEQGTLLDGTKQYTKKFLYSLQCISQVYCPKFVRVLLSAIILESLLLPRLEDIYFNSISRRKKHPLNPTNQKVTFKH